MRIRSGLIFNLLLLLILALGLYLRVYHIGDFNNFFHDQGRDALVVKRIIVDKKLTLLGPQTTAPGVYLGPLYYYLSIIPLVLTNLNPVGMDYMVAIFGTGAILLIYLLVKEMFGKNIAFLTSALYATSPVVIAFSNHAWNPNPLPFFMLLTVLGIYKVFESGNERYWLAIFIGMACAVQIHLFSIVLLPLLIFFWLARKYKVGNWKTFLASLAAGIMVLFPWFLFEIRHGFLNTRNLFNFIIGEKVGVSGVGFIERVSSAVYWLGSLVASGGIFVYLFFALLIFAVIVHFRRFETKLILVWFLMGLLVIGIYQGIYQPYHSLFLTPLPFLFFALIAASLWRSRWLSYLVIFAACVVVFFNLQSYDFEKKGNRLGQLVSVAKIIKADLDEGGAQQFNLAALTARFDHNAMDYRYFLEMEGARALGLDEFSKAEILYVISEGQREDLLNSEIMEIKNFNPRKILAAWSVSGDVKVIKLGK